jgi:hypothetical protein
MTERDIVELWLEYEEGASREALVAHELDKFDMVVQADEYETGSRIACSAIIFDAFARRCMKSLLRAHRVIHNGSIASHNTSKLIYVLRQHKAQTCTSSSRAHRTASRTRR